MSLDRLAPALFVLLWSTGWVAAKFGSIVSEPLTFLAIRYATAAVLFAVFCLVVRATWPKDRATVAHAVISGAFLHGFYLAAVWWAIGQGVPAAKAVIIGERLTKTQKLGLVLGFSGVAIAILPKFLEVGNGEIAALALLVNVIGMASVTYGTIYQKQHLHTGDIRSIATLQYVGALIVTLPLALVLETPSVELGWGFFALLAWSVLGISMGAILLLLYLLRRGQVSRAASLVYLVPPIAALQAALIFGEELTLPMIAGTAVVVAGVYLCNRKETPPAPAE